MVIKSQIMMEDDSHKHFITKYKFIDCIGKITMNKNSKGRILSYLMKISPHTVIIDGSTI